jgi:hypothetical protein
MPRSAFFHAPTLATLAALGLLAAPALAAPPEGAADLVARSLRSELFSGGSVRMRAHLVLTEKDGKRQERTFSAWAKRDTQGLRRTLVRFEAPAAVEGIAFLMTQREREPDEQYLYLPKFKSTRRIAGAAERQGSFMGSDFSYADLERRDVRDATYEALADEPIGGKACAHVVARPKGASAYARVELWIRRDDGVPLRIAMFDADGALLKTTSTKRVRAVGGEPVVVESRTENAKSGHVTELVVDEIVRDDALDDAFFSPANLAR